MLFKDVQRPSGLATGNFFIIRVRGVKKSRGFGPIHGMAVVGTRCSHSLFFTMVWIGFHPLGHVCCLCDDVVVCLWLFAGFLPLPHSTGKLGFICLVPRDWAGGVRHKFYFMETERTGLLWSYLHQRGLNAEGWSNSQPRRDVEAVKADVAALGPQLELPTVLLVRAGSILEMQEWWARGPGPGAESADGSTHIYRTVFTCSLSDRFSCYVGNDLFAIHRCFDWWSYSLWAGACHWSIGFGRCDWLLGHHGFSWILSLGRCLGEELGIRKFRWSQKFLLPGQSCWCCGHSNRVFRSGLEAPGLLRNLSAPIWRKSLLQSCARMFSAEAGRCKSSPQYYGDSWTWVLVKCGLEPGTLYLNSPSLLWLCGCFLRHSYLRSFFSEGIAACGQL